LSLPYILAIVFIAVFALSVVVGYGFCYTILGPVILRRHGIRKLSESFLWPGNILQIENELKDLAAKGMEPLATSILKAISISKYSSLVSFLGFIICFVIAAT